MGRQRGGSAPRLRAPAASAGSPITLTGRGGIVVIFGTGLLGALLAQWFGLPVLAGAGFAAGCVLAAFATRQADLLTLAVSPPLVFFAATLLAEFTATIGQGSMVRGLTLGLLTSLASTAPWLFLGEILVLAITIPRGLLANYRELRTKLAGIRLFAEEENENPVRWDESPSSSRRPPHADID